jgi:glutamate racemase
MLQKIAATKKLSVAERYCQVQTKYSPITIKMPTNASPIAVLDSGLGGLTVVRELRRQCPAESIIYFGDTARVPYGIKSPETVTTFVREIITYLQRYRPKHVVIACNTATAVAVDAIKQEFPHLPITGVIEPGARAAIDAAGNKPVPRIGVIATEATARSKAYDRAIHRRRQHARIGVFPTPLLVPIIEDGREETDPLVQLALSQYLQPLLEKKLDVLVLGCTHYPIFKNLITRMMGGTCRVIDSAEQCAKDVAQRLVVNGLAADESNVGDLKCFVTDDPIRFGALAGRFLGTSVVEAVKVAVDDLMKQPPLRAVG